MATPTAADRRAALRYGPLVRGVARRYTNPYTGKRLSGAALLLKLASLESSFDSGAVSSAGARGRTQFTPGSRATVLKRFGVDPWRSVDEAYHGAALHLLGKVNGSAGLAGYNPGDPAYTGQVLRQRVGRTRGGDQGAGGATQGTVGVPGTAGAQNVAMGSTGALALLAALGQGKPQVQSSTPPLPSFAASPVLPQGYHAPSSGGGPAPKTNVDDLLAQIRTAGGDVALAPGSSGVPGMESVTGGFGSTHGKGRVVVAPGADRPGVRTSGAVIDFARQISGIAGTPVRIGTGSRHSRLTVNGTVSDHWQGRAADIPATGQRLVSLGRAALIAAGMDPAKARRINGGGFNVGGWQVIFATNAPGWGDHTTHLHIGRRRR